MQYYTIQNFYALRNLIDKKFFEDLFEVHDIEFFWSTVRVDF
jgi:hypothetical protein